MILSEVLNQWNDIIASVLVYKCLVINANHVVLRMPLVNTAHFVDPYFVI